MPEVLVTAITPTFNRARYLAQAIESVLEQGFPGLEHVVVDDGSTDDTEAVVRRHGDRVRYHRQPNAGQSAAWNTALSLARGEVVAFLDSDDAWLPGKIARQLPLLEREPRAALLYADVRYVDGEGRPIAEPRLPRATPSGRVLRDLLADNFIRTPTVLARRRLLLEAGGFRPELVQGNDWDMWLRLATRHEVIHDPVPSALYRLHGDQMVADRWKLATARVRILEDHLPRLEREAPEAVPAARKALGDRLLRVAKLHLREGRREEARALVDRAVALAPGLRLRALRMRLQEGVRRLRRPRPS